MISFPSTEIVPLNEHSSYNLPLVFHTFDIPEVKKSKDKKSKKVPISVKVSHYWPPLGGPNCAYFSGGVCLSRMASGKPWHEWVDRALACPKEIPFGTIFYIFDKEWVCLDRGGKVISLGKVIWVDLLTPKAPVPYGTIVDAFMVLPKD